MKLTPVVFLWKNYCSMSIIGATLVSNKQVPSPPGYANCPADFLVVYNQIMSTEIPPEIDFKEYALSHPEKMTREHRIAILENYFYYEQELARRAVVGVRFFEEPTVSGQDREYDELIGGEL